METAYLHSNGKWTKCNAYELQQKMNDENRLQFIESWFDNCGVGNVLLAIELVCGRKQTHVIENWQDDRLAEQWKMIDKHVEKCRARLLEKQRQYPIEL